MTYKEKKELEQAIDRTKTDIRMLAKLHGLPVVICSNVKEPTLIVPENFELPRLEHLNNNKQR